MADFDFKKSSKRCSVTDRALLPGEEYVSALLEVDDQTQRVDFGLDSWSEPPENCVGWWRTRMPDSIEGKVYWAPDDVLLSYFDHVRQSPGMEEVAYVMALLLVRKKTLRLEEMIDTDAGQQMVVFDKREKETFDVPVADLEPGQLAAIQDELAEKLFTDQPVEADDIDEATEL